MFLLWLPFVIIFPIYWISYELFTVRPYERAWEEYFPCIRNYQTSRNCCAKATNFVCLVILAIFFCKFIDGIAALGILLGVLIAYPFGIVVLPI